jgi:hypothetical protein
MAAVFSDNIETLITNYNSILIQLFHPFLLINSKLDGESQSNDESSCHDIIIKSATQTHLPCSLGAAIQAICNSVHPSPRLFIHIFWSTWTQKKPRPQKFDKKDPSIIQIVRNATRPQSQPGGIVNQYNLFVNKSPPTTLSSMVVTSPPASHWSTGQCLIRAYSICLGVDVSNWSNLVEYREGVKKIQIQIVLLKYYYLFLSQVIGNTIINLGK